MDFGIVELISILMGISGFSVGTNPAAPAPAAALEYAMPDADAIAYVDVGAIVPGNYKVLTNLPNQPQIKASPELAKAVRKMIAEVDGPRGLVKGMTGIDLTSDISDLTASMRYVPKHDPDVLVAVHGKFTTATIEKVAAMAQQTATKVGGGAWFEAGDGNAVGVTKAGVLLAGSTSLVKDRMADTYKAPALTTGTTLGNAADVLAQKPVFAVVLAMSPAARADALKDSGKPNFLTDLVKRHKLYSFSVLRDGVAWTWIDSTKAGLDSFAQVSDGLVDILRAAQVAPRGFAKIMLGALDSYKGTSKQLDNVIAHKADLEKIIGAYTGDGQFKADVAKDTKTNKLTVRLTGKSLTEVLPLGGLVPMGAMAFFVMRSGDAKESTESSPAPQPMTVQPIQPGKPAKPAKPSPKAGGPAQKTM